MPATVLTGTFLARQAGAWRAVTWTAAGLALALAATATATTRLDTATLIAAACPEHLLSTGAMQEVQIDLGSCDACATPLATVDHVTVVGADGRERPAPAGDVEIVEEGATPRLRLRAASAPGESWGGWPGPWTRDEAARRYIVHLRTATEEGAAWQQPASPDTLDVDVFVMPRPYEPHYRPVFTCRADAN